MQMINFVLFRDGVPQRTLDLVSDSKKPRYGFLDPYVNVTGKPIMPRVNNWTYLTSDTFYHTAFFKDTSKTFRLSMSTVLQYMGSLQGVQVQSSTMFVIQINNDMCLIQVRAEVFVTDFLYNNTQKGWCETRIINNTLDLSFVGSKPLVFKPGMPFDAQIAVRYSDQVFS